MCRLNYAAFMPLGLCLISDTSYFPNVWVFGRRRKNKNRVNFMKPTQ